MMLHLSLFFCLFALASCVERSLGKVAHTDCGHVAGSWDPKFRSFAFRGIPYAMPPIGERRWKRSKLLSEGGGCWNGTLDTRSRTDEYMDSQCCVQNPSMRNNSIDWDGIEDCLTLDVRSPMENSGTLRPVLVMIHGGSLMSGVPDIPYAFRDEGFVLVGVRYRLNVLGFIALSALTKRDDRDVSGNYGFSDQVTALEWVQRNAKAFGGDPERVTIMGCSSGGSSVWNLLAIPSARGLFARAVPLSAASKNNMSLQQAQEQNSQFVEFVCGSSSKNAYTCLMEAKLEEIMMGFMNLSKSVGFDHPFDFELPSPEEYQSGVCIVDGDVVQSDLHTALSTSGLHSPVPVLSGSCSQEGDTEWLNSRSTAQDYELIVRGFVENLTSLEWPVDAVNTILHLYPPTSDEFFGSPKAAMDAMVADVRVVCGTLYNAERLVHGRPHNVSAKAVDLWLYYSDMRAMGGYEMSHCNTLDVLCDAECSGCNPDKKQFHKRMLEVHSEFVKNGNPPSGTLRRFSDERSYVVNSITANISSPRYGVKERCEFWRNTKILEDYAWDELTAAIQARLLI